MSRTLRVPSRFEVSSMSTDLYYSFELLQKIVLCSPRLGPDMMKSSFARLS